MLTGYTGGCYSAFRIRRGGVAQVVEQTAHIRWVRGSNPFAAIFFCLLCCANESNHVASR